jgi:putative glutathione S-transferase
MATSNSEFRDKVTADGSSGFKAEANRYHLYLSLGCPFGQRAYAMLVAKGLEKAISFTITDIFMGPPGGWRFTDKRDKCTLDTVNGCENLKQIFLKANPNFDGRVTVPTLWDKVKQTVVNNDSREIMEMFNSEFNEFSATPEQAKLDFNPIGLKKEIDEVYELASTVSGVGYAAGFATDQEVYNTKVQAYYEGVDKLENLLSKQRYLVGKTITIADVAFFTVLVRFDWLYFTLLKCDKKRLSDYPNLWDYCRDLYQSYGLGSSVDGAHIRGVPFSSYKTLNPSGVVPIGLEIDFTKEHQRDKL